MADEPQQEASGRSNKDRRAAVQILSLVLKDPSVSGWTKAIVALCGLPILIGSGLATTLLSFKQWGWAVLVFAMTLAVVVVAIVMIGRRVGRALELEPSAQSGDRSPGPSRTTIWERDLPRIKDGDQTDVSSLRVHVQKIGQAAVDWVSKEYSRANDGAEYPSTDVIRANVFSPEISKPDCREICELSIYKGMTHNMSTFKPELGLRFRPDEGLTGRVFHKGTAGGVTGIPQDDGTFEWKSVPVTKDPPTDDELRAYRLTEEQIGRISQRLRWLISMPLRREKDDPKTTMAVINVDGLDEFLGPKLMAGLREHLQNAVDLFAHDMAKLPASRLEISVADV